MLSILNSFAKYFYTTNESLPKCENTELIKQKRLYVVFGGNTAGIHISFEKIIRQKIEAKYTGVIYWNKYMNIKEALAHARKILGINYFIKPAAEEYIQKFKRAKNKKTQELHPR